jgi:hypothetical protein
MTQTPRGLEPARMTARRDRQIREIAGLVAAGDRQRAAGLAREHAAEFPDDAGRLAEVTAERWCPGSQLGDVATPVAGAP